METEAKGMSGKIVYTYHAASLKHDTQYLFRIRSWDPKIQFGIQGLVEIDQKWFIDFDIKFTSTEIVKEEFNPSTEEMNISSEAASLPAFKQNDLIIMSIASNEVAIYVNDIKQASS